MLKRKPIVATLLAVLILSTSLGTMVYKHYCGDALQEVAFAVLDKHCTHHSQESELPPCHQHEAEMEGCCKTEVQKIATEEIQPQKDSNSTLKADASIVSVVYALLNDLFSSSLDSYSYSLLLVYEGPPLYNIHLQILYQSFLI